MWQLSTIVSKQFNSTPNLLFTRPKQTHLYCAFLAMGEWKQPESKIGKSETSAGCSFPTYLPLRPLWTPTNNPLKQKPFQLTEVNPAATFDTIRDISLFLCAKRQWVSWLLSSFGHRHRPTTTPTPTTTSKLTATPNPIRHSNHGHW